MEDKSILIDRGSTTAKNGFRNEQDIADKFNDWKNDTDAQKWLEIMGYVLKEIEKVEAVRIKLKSVKPDVQVKITIYLKNLVSPENISIKLVSNEKSGFNQIDKRWVSKYVEMWNIPENLATTLKRFTGELSPNKTDIKDNRRMYLTEMPKEEQDAVVKFFSDNKILIISDLIKGRGQLSADWMLVALKSEVTSKWVLKDINDAMNTFGQGDIRITTDGNLKIGKIGMQRKGGDNGRDTANMLQFKADPLILFE